VTGGSSKGGRWEKGGGEEQGKKRGGEGGKRGGRAQSPPAPRKRPPPRHGGHGSDSAAVYPGSVHTGGVLSRRPGGLFNHPLPERGGGRAKGDAPFPSSRGATCGVVPSTGAKLHIGNKPGSSCWVSVQRPRARDQRPGGVIVSDLGATSTRTAHGPRCAHSWCLPPPRFAFSRLGPCAVTFWCVAISSFLAHQVGFSPGLLFPRGVRHPAGFPLDSLFRARRGLPLTGT